MIMDTDHVVTDFELKEQLVETTTELYRAGLVTATGGNLSVRSVERENAIWITPSQIFKGALKPEQMTLIDMDGKRLEGDYKPSIESVFHAGVMKLRPEIHAVVHTHAPLATVFGMIDLQLLPVTTEAIFLMEYPHIPWYMGGSKDLAKAVMEMVGQTKAMGAFLRNHGLLTLGKSLRQAADNTLMAEHTAKILLTLKMTGMEPSLIPEKAVKFLSQFAGAL
ncbi:MAG: class II aldolase/adducin family protein [Chloroflexi bacterium]|nr:class II aldolase/adducin family protein [Chloroflexota bacterium]